MKTKVILDHISTLEQQISLLECEIAAIVRQTYMDALREHTCLTDLEIHRRWLQHNATNLQLET